MTVDDWRRFETELSTDPDLRAAYRRQMRMESHLRELIAEPSAAAPPVFLPPPPTDDVAEPGRNRRTAVVGTLAAVAATTLIAVGFWTRPDRSKPAVASLDVDGGAVWDAGGDDARPADGRLAPGVLALRSGLARVRFDSGATISLEGPTRLSVDGADRARLLRGRVVVESDAAAPLIVETPHGSVDAGTWYAVEADAAADETRCEILGGNLAIHHRPSGTDRTYDGRRAFVLTAADLRPLDHLPSVEFSRRRSETIVIGTRGVETSVVEGDRRGQRLDPAMLMVKHSYSPEVTTADRRALFEFDVREIDPSSGRCRLRLNQIPSGLGFAAHTPAESAFALYGITDDSEDWTDRIAAGLRWDQTPGFKDDKENNAVEHLLDFTLPRGSQTGTVLLEDDALTRFVRSDRTGHVGFLLVRKTRGTKPYSLVHAFASSRHPQIGGPTLEWTPHRPAAVAMLTARRDSEPHLAHDGG